MELFDKIAKREYGLLFLVFILSFGFYLFILTRSPLIYGNDGPYYLIQVRSLFEASSLKYGDLPLSFFLFAFFTLFFNGDMIFGIRFSVALFSALTNIPLFFWTKKVTNCLFSSYIVMFICTFSAPHIRLFNGPLKNTVGAFFLTCFIFYLHSIIMGGKNKWDFFLCTVFLLLTATTHILDFGVALLFLILYPLVVLIFSPDKRNYLLKTIGFMLLIILFFSILAYLTYPMVFSDFHKGLAFFNALFSGKGEYSEIRYLFDYLSGIFILPILIIGFILSLYEWKKGKKPVTVITVTIIGLLLTFPIIPDGWYYRIVLMEFIPISFIVGYVTSKTTSKIFSNPIYQIIFVFIILILIHQSVLYSKRLSPSINEEKYQEMEFIMQNVSNNSIIVCPRQNYWVEYITRSDVTRNLSNNIGSSYDNVYLFLEKRFYDETIVPIDSKKIVEETYFILYKLNELN